MSFPNIVNMANLESFNTYTTEYYPVGTRAITEDGREYRFTENGGTALVVANIIQSRLEVVADSTGQAVATMAAGATVLTGVAAANNSFAVDVLKYGYVFTDTAADTNPAYRVKSNTLITFGASTGTITLYEPLQAAIAAASTICYMRNPWRDVIQAVASTPTAAVVGGAVKAIPVDNFGWVQTHGPFRVLTQGTLVIGDPVTNGSDAGSAAPTTATTAPIFGYVLKVEATTEMSLIFLTID